MLISIVLLHFRRPTYHIVVLPLLVSFLLFFVSHQGLCAPDNVVCPANCIQFECGSACVRSQCGLFVFCALHKLFDVDQVCVLISLLVFVNILFILKFYYVLSSLSVVYGFNMASMYQNVACVS